MPPNHESQRSPQGYRFGPFYFDPADHRLTRAGEVVEITPKVLDTLLILVEQPGRLVEKEELIKRLWPDTFVQDAALARHISDLRRVLGEDARSSRYIETVPKRGYRFIAEVQRTEHSDSVPAEERSSSVSGLRPAVSTRSFRSPARSAAAVVAGVAIVGALAWAWARSSPSPAPPIHSIAVLPFSSPDDGEAERAVGNGIADMIIGRLIRVPSIAVRPIGAVRDYLDAPSDPQASGRRLQVDAVLTGELSRHGSALAVKARLVHVESGRVLWSGTVDGGGLSSIERTLSAQLLDALHVPPDDRARARVVRRQTTDDAANLAYVRGRYFWGRRTREGLERAVALLEEVVGRDPSFALGHAGLADAYLLLSGFRPEAEMTQRARSAARRALELDPDLGEAHAALGLIAMNYDWDWAGAEREYRTSIQLSPQYATAHAWYGEFLAYMGRFDEAVAEMDVAAKLDPLSLIISTDRGKVLFLARRFDDAVAQLQHTLELDPEYPLARSFLALAQSSTGRHEEAIRAVTLTGQDADPLFLSTRAFVFQRAGRMKEARAAATRLIELSRRSHVSDYLVGYAHIAIGDRDTAFRFLSSMCDQRGVGAIAMLVNPMSDSVRDDPRFRHLLARVGLNL